MPGRTSTRDLVFWVVAACASACGPRADVDDGDGVNACPAGTQTELRGRVLAPNGIDPIPGALVYVPRELAPFPPSVQCEVCDQVIENAIVFTSSDVDGTFRLGPLPTAADQLPGAPVEVVAQIGRFRRLATITISNPCGENVAPDAAFRLPSRSAGHDSVPRIAVVTGAFDVMECVLVDLGLDPDAFDLYDGYRAVAGGNTPGTVAPFDTLLRDLNRMTTYDVIFINCSSNQYETMLTDATVRANLQAYSRAGGRLYVTDWSYDYIEQVEEFASRIDFAPDASGPAPELANAAQVGQGGITTEAYVHDDEMVAWLEAVERVSGESIIGDDRRVHIEHFLGSWAMQLAGTAKVWLTGKVSGGGLEQELPLTTSFDYEQCGRVLYTSYHTLGREPSAPDATFPSYCRTGNLSPQERVLMYLILHISDCLVVE